SLKDVPAELAAGCALAAVLQRTDPMDAVCLPLGERPRAEAPRATLTGTDAGEVVAGGDAASMPAGRLLAGLPATARVGTSSLRRRTQLLALRSDLQVCAVRGNIGSRLDKLDAGRHEALVLARAGLSRLGLVGRATASFALEEMLPAAGQGALAVEVRLADDRARARLQVFDDRKTRLATTAERTFMRSLGGSCTVPMAAYAEVDGKAVARVRLRALVGDVDGNVLRDEECGSAEEAESLGSRLAERMLRQGGAELLGRAAAHPAEEGR
ncbi:MAG: hydroxymethylbilane synthase, partial [Acidobacteriota bacterium]